MSNLFVVVNLTRGPCLGTLGQFYVLPGEDPHTFGSLEEAVMCQAQMAIEFDHTIDSAAVYRLVPVPDEIVKPLFERMKAELEKEWEEADVV